VTLIALGKRKKRGIESPTKRNSGKPSVAKHSAREKNPNSARGASIEIRA